MSAIGRKRRLIDTRTYSGRLAERVRTIRESKRMTVKRLAERIGISAAVLYGWENGTRTIPTDRIPEVAKSLGIKPVSALFPDR